VGSDQQEASALRVSRHASGRRDRPGNDFEKASAGLNGPRDECDSTPVRGRAAPPLRKFFKQPRVNMEADLILIQSFLLVQDGRTGGNAGIGQALVRPGKQEHLTK